MNSSGDARVPTPEERRRAVCEAMAIAPGLVRFAARYTRSIEDAEDAYQRTMEIALTRAPSAERARFMAWLRTVLRNEALAIAGLRVREAPTGTDEVESAAGPSVEPGPELRAEWRERYLAVSDALARLSEAQRICLMLQSAGASYALIGEITGYSPRKVERSVLEGRASLRDWELRITEGEACLRVEESIGRVALGEAGAKERRQVTRHVRHCRSCRSLLTRRSDARDRMGALVPLGLLGGGLAEATPDPGPYMAALDRVGTGLTVRAGQALQVAMDLPGSGLARAAAAAGAVVLALAAGLPVLGDVVDDRADGPGRIRPAMIAAPAATADADDSAGRGEPAAAVLPPSQPREPSGRKTLEDEVRARHAAPEAPAAPGTAPPLATASATSPPVAAPATPSTPAPPSPVAPVAAPAPDSLDPGPAAPAGVPAPGGGALATSIGP